MTREEATAYWKQRSKHIHNWLEENEDVDFIGEYVEAIDMAIEALSAEGDLISRADAIEAIASRDETDGTIKVFTGRQVNEILTALQSARPTGDVVEVVRCKNCKWYEADIMGNPWGVCCHNGWVGGHSGHEVSEDGWCYRAEMMEVEHETD